MRVLVTGCAGFIGSRVCEILLADDYGVVGVDEKAPYRLQKVWPSSNFSWRKCDIVVDEHRFPDVDAVIHLAAQAGVRASVDDPQSCYAVNLFGTLKLLEYCVQHNIRKFIFSSSSSVYGDARGPFREDMPTRPTSPYAASKLAAEQLAYVYHLLHGLDVSVLRYFTVYGPAGRPDMAVMRFVKWICEGEDVMLYGDGSQIRDFTYIDDVARGTIAALTPVGYKVINLGSGQPYSLCEVIEKIEGITQKVARLKILPPSDADVPLTYADNTLAGELLNWRPSVDIDAGLARTIAWYEENRDWAKELV